MEALEKNKQFYFKNEDSFGKPFENIHFYSMDDYSIGMHRQDFFEINIITRGKGVHFIENNTLNAEVGDVFIIPPEVDHGYKGGHGFDVYHIIINNKYMQKNFTELQAIAGFSMLFNVEPLMRISSAKPLHLKLAADQLQSIAGLLFDRRNRKHFVSTEEEFINIGTFIIIVTKLCQFYIKNTAVLKEGANIHDANFMRALSLIHERYNEKLTIDRLAREAKLSKSTFMRRFLYICKIPPAEYITRKRIEIAENMLLNSNASVSEIAEKVGFYDTAHFFKTFVKYHGCSPLEHRKQNRKE